MEHENQTEPTVEDKPKRGPKPKPQRDPVDVVIELLEATPGGSNIARHVARLLKDA
jgi:hypothetical protein